MNPTIFNGVLPSVGTKGQVTWSSPSNIALTKYWGKHGQQLPRNSSISFTLSHARTTTTVAFEVIKPSEDIALGFQFEGEEKPEFADRIRRFLSKNETYLPYVRHLAFQITSENSFPHSSGIASSASAMSCLIMALIDIEEHHFGHSMDATNKLQRASFLSRLASGSASRSVFPGAAFWGTNEDILGSSDLFAIAMEETLHPVFKSYHDDIVIVSAGEKSVSSSAGHDLMNNNPYSQIRFDQANRNTTAMVDALKRGDLEQFIKITESEALTLHALMMTSDPSYILMEPGTLSVIQKIRAFRKKNDIPIAFTLDAGPNVHVLYPHENEEVCHRFIEEELRPLSTGQIIRDKVGQGPRKEA